MAEKKTEPPKTAVPAVADQQSKAVIPWEEQLKALATHTAETEKPSGNWVSFKNGVFSYNGTQMKDNRANVVIIHSIHENQWYPRPYNPNLPENPSCFAFAENEDDLAPHPDSADPQAPTCAQCPKNAWGSDPQGGRGKACKNVRRLAMVHQDDLKNLDKAAVALAKTPVTSTKNWATYASQIANVMKLPPLAVITEVSVTPSDRQFDVNFNLVDRIQDPELIQALLRKRQDATPVIFAPYSKNIELPPKGAAPADGKKY